MVQQHFENARIALIDGIVALGITLFWVVPAERRVLDLRHFPSSGIALADLVFPAFFVFAWGYCFTTLDLYSSVATMPSRMWETLKGVLIMSSSTVVYLALFHSSYLEIGHLILLVLALYAYEINRIFVSGYLLDRFAARDPRRAIILGSGRRAGKAWREIRTRYNASIHLLGFLDDRDPELMAPEVAQRYIGTVDDLSETILTQVVDVILIAMPIQSCYPIMQRVVDIAEGVGVQVIYLGDIYSSGRSVRVPNETMFRELAPLHNRYLVQLATKRFVDVVCAGIALIVLSPIFLAITIGLLVTGGAVLLRQERYGHRRRLFSVLKFGSATEPVSRHSLSPSINGQSAMSGSGGSKSAFGRFLRKTSLDELPQLWNVLMGDMSIVGPRPMTVEEVAQFSDATLIRRFSVKPGMTGLWRTIRRSKVTLEEWLAIDKRYVDEWSLSMDMHILLQTVSLAIKRSSGMLS
jgi:lipopolysaccharide/colanic/teichoic acid biosynthesis glycosyltransferase